MPARDPYETAPVDIRTTNTLDGRAPYAAGYELDLHANYAFDVSGFLRVPGLLPPATVAALNAALDSSGALENLLDQPEPHRDPFRELLVEPRSVGTLTQLIGSGYRLDGQQPRLLTEATPLAGGAEPRDPGRAYYWKNGHRYCQSVHLLLALTDIAPSDGGFAIVPCTHRSNTPARASQVSAADPLPARRSTPFSTRSLPAACG